MRIFIKNDQGKPSVSLTMVVISFSIVTLWLVCWLVGTTFGLAVPPFDAVTAMTFLTPQLGLYFGRRFNSKTNANGTVEIQMQETVSHSSMNTTQERHQ